MDGSAVHNNCDTHANYNQVQYNIITNTQIPANSGITIDSADLNPWVGPSAYSLNNAIQHNTITHFGSGFIKLGAGGTITGVFAPNTILP